jgi:lactate dehydrogenase-like 2-hydroxyacid dehydrogenase
VPRIKRDFFDVVVKVACADVPSCVEVAVAEVAIEVAISVAISISRCARHSKVS